MRISRKATNDQPLRLDQRKFRATAAAVIVAMLAGAAVLPLAPPSRFSGLPTCVLKSATGLPCPFCGGSRATQALLCGDLSRAVYLNVAALPAVPGRPPRRSEPRCASRSAPTTAASP